MDPVALVCLIIGLGTLFVLIGILVKCFYRHSTTFDPKYLKTRRELSLLRQISINNQSKQSVVIGTLQSDLLLEMEEEKEGDEGGVSVMRPLL